jgi:hypothetical protein
VADGARERVTRYVAELVPQLLLAASRADRTYMSARTYARNLPECILAAAAYHHACGTPEPLRLGAMDALRYAVAAKLQLSPAALEPLHRALQGLLTDQAIPDAVQLQLEAAALIDHDERRSWLETHWASVMSSTPPDEVEKLVGSLVGEAMTKGQRDRLVPLREFFDRIGYAGDGRRRVEAQLVLLVRQVVRAASDGLSALATTSDASPIGSSVSRQRAALSRARRAGPAAARVVAGAVDGVAAPGRGVRARASDGPCPAA